ncbi:MAG: response regulator transcription factor [Candidatus Brocadiaceae bacterium]|nr:response regulator transcription factor [Candidatus Brocadiaceae bacterium]
MPINVTIIEDEKTILECLKILLAGSKNIRIIGAFQSGERAIDAIATNPPDVVLVDLELKLDDISGIEVIKRIKESLPEVNIMVFTKFDDDGHLFPAIKAGAVGYLLKDASPAEIINAIEDVCKGYAPMSGRIARRILEEHHHAPMKKGHNDFTLTPREMEILEKLSKGLDPKAIAKELDIKYDTVRSHLKNIYKKLHVNCMIEAVARAKENGLIRSRY